MATRLDRGEAGSCQLYCGLLEELFIYLLDVQGLFDTAADAVAYHQAGKLVAVDKHDAIA